MAAGQQVQGEKGWIALVAVGVLSIGAGILAVVWPEITLLTLALITGINLMVLGALAIGQALADSGSEDRTLRIVLGVLGIIAGLVIVRRPGETLLVIVIAAGIWLVLSGLLEILGAVVMPGRRMLRVASGAIDIVLGVLVLSLPKVSLGTLAVLIGLAFIVRGAVMAYAGWQLRHVGAVAPSHGARAAPA